MRRPFLLPLVFVADDFGPQLPSKIGSQVHSSLLGLLRDLAAGLGIHERAAQVGPGRGDEDRQKHGQAAGDAGLQHGKAAAIGAGHTRPEGATAGQPRATPWVRGSRDRWHPERVRPVHN